MGGRYMPRPAHFGPALSVAFRLVAWLTGDISGDDSIARGLTIEEAFDEAAYTYRAFSSKDNPAEWMRAADYSDQWMASAEGIFSAYYICMAGGVRPNVCNTVIAAKS